MSALPPDIFRRVMGPRVIEDAEFALQKVERTMLGDFAVTAKAAKYHLAAIVAKLIDRPDLQDEFEQIRDEAVARAREEVTIRRPPSRQNRRRPDPEPDATVRKRPRQDDRPRDGER